MRDNFAAIGQAALVNATAKAQTVPNLTLMVSAFDYVGATGVRGTYAGGISPALTGPTTNPRIALLAFTPATTTFAWIYGTEAASPIPPGYLFGIIPIVEVYCRVGLASITNTDTGTNGYILRLAPRVGPFDNPLTGVGDLIVGATAGLPSRLPSAASGQVLISQGAGAAPVWSTDPAIRNLLVQGGAVGTSGVGVLALGPIGAPSPPTTSPVDTVQFYTIDMSGEAGSRGLALRDERAGISEFGSVAAGLQWNQKVASVQATMSTTPTGSNVGTVSNHPLYILQNSAVVMQFATDGFIYVGREMHLQGALQIAYPGPTLFINKPVSGQAGAIYGQTAGVSRWQVALCNADAETGANAGSNFAIYATTDAGVYLSTPLTLVRGDTTNPVLLLMGGLYRNLMLGAPDSGGAGYRLVRVGN
jgi:hypothetical protein